MNTQAILDNQAHTHKELAEIKAMLARIEQILTAHEGESDDEIALRVIRKISDEVAPPPKPLPYYSLIETILCSRIHTRKNLPVPPKEEHSWIDDNDYHWEWDGNRVYCLEAEKEMMENGEDVSQNGYPASSPDEALSILMAGGYIEPTEGFYATLKEGIRDD